MSRRRTPPAAAAAAVFIAVFASGAAVLLVFAVEHRAAWTVVGAVSGVAAWLVWRRSAAPAGHAPSAAHVRVAGAAPEPIAGAPSETPVGEEVAPGLPFKVSFRTMAAAATVFQPGTATGPATLRYLLTGHELGMRVVSTGAEPVEVASVRAEVAARRTFTEDPVLDLIPVDPLELPHFEVLLDAEPPVVRRAIGAGGEPARPGPDLPFTVEPGSTVMVFMAPLTDDERFTEWRLTAVVRCRGEEFVYDVPVRTTAHSGWREFDPGGGARDIPGSEWAGRIGHWTPQQPG